MPLDALFRRARAAALALLGLALLAPPQAGAAEDFSPSEQALFMQSHLAGLKPKSSLRYHYAKTGSLEPGFEGDAVVTLADKPGGGCCKADTRFLDGPQRLTLPEVEEAAGNPIVLHFLEREVREMNRHTKGQAAYFRKRIRMAIYQGAQLEPTTVEWRGQSVPAQRISLAPYLDDPLRPRFEQLAPKRYTFILSKAVPGGVVSMRSRVDGPAGQPPLWQEELWLDGTRPTP